MEDIIFDGKWSHTSEWKQSSHNMYSFDDGKNVIHLRTAHYENFIYVFVDPIFDLTLNDKIDEATICFDANNDKTIFFDTNDFCFSTTMNSKTGNTFQGTLNPDSSVTMKKISNHDDFIAISSVSDENDRYSDLPHPSYEFRIPIEMLDRSDNYGFYMSIYEATSDEFFSWPENYTRTNSEIPNPSYWGDIISPDKSLPEIHFPIVILVVLISTVIFLQSKTKIVFSRF